MKYFAPLVYHNFIFTDIDECSDNNGGCSEQCVNTDESYHCTCKTGYKLKDDKKTCVGKFIILFLIAYGQKFKSTEENRWKLSVLGGKSKHQSSSAELS